MPAPLLACSRPRSHYMLAHDAPRQGQAHARVLKVAGAVQALEDAEQPLGAYMSNRPHRCPTPRTRAGHPPSAAETDLGLFDLGALYFQALPAGSPAPCAAAPVALHDQAGLDVHLEHARGRVAVQLFDDEACQLRQIDWLVRQKRLRRERLSDSSASIMPFRAPQRPEWGPGGRC